jgi:hypothetical protein
MPREYSRAARTYSALRRNARSEKCRVQAEAGAQLHRPPSVLTSSRSPLRSSRRAGRDCHCSDVATAGIFSV